MASIWILDGLICDGSGAAPYRGNVCLSGDRIESVGAPGVNTPQPGDRTIDATGLVVAPGLIDLHTHVYDGMNLHSVAPADAGLRTGVTTLLDMGSAGALNYGTFAKYVIPHAAETVFALLNISQYGVQGHPEIAPYLGDLHDVRRFDVASAVQCLEAHRGVLIGVKVRLTLSLTDNRPDNERAALAAALEVRDRTGLPLYVHHVASSIPLPELLQALRQDDVLTHFYHAMGDGGFTGPDGAPGAGLLDARRRGIVFDVGHGSGCFSWQLAERACAVHGFWPDTISSDIHRFNIESPVVDLATTMTKFLALGMPLERVIAAVTTAPAAVMGKSDQFGRLMPGAIADITLLQERPGQHALVDSMGQVRPVSQRLIPLAVWKTGALHRCAPPYAPDAATTIDERGA